MFIRLRIKQGAGEAQLPVVERKRFATREGRQVNRVSCRDAGKCQNAAAVTHMHPTRPNDVRGRRFTRVTAHICNHARWFDTGLIPPRRLGVLLLPHRCPDAAVMDIRWLIGSLQFDAHSPGIRRAGRKQTLNQVHIFSPNILRDFGVAAIACRRDDIEERSTRHRHPDFGVGKRTGRGT